MSGIGRTLPSPIGTYLFDKAGKESRRSKDALGDSSNFISIFTVSENKVFDKKDTLQYFG